MNSSKLSLSDRLYWLGYNLIRYPICLIEIPIMAVWSIFLITGILFKTDGSETLSFPWE